MNIEGLLTQLAEFSAFNRNVPGSIPGGPIVTVAQLVRVLGCEPGDWDSNSHSHLEKC